MRYRLQEQIPTTGLEEWENLIEAENLLHLNELVIKHYQYRNPNCAYRILDNDTKKYDVISMFFSR
jgi:hypothetical protein